MSHSNSKTALEVRSTTFELAGMQMNGYTADELDGKGELINYLSGTQMAEVIELDHTTTVQKRLSETLKFALGVAFTVVQGKYKMTSGGVTKLNLWRTSDAVEYWAYHAFENGNRIARNISKALMHTSLDIIINDAFDREYKRGKAEEMTKTRLEGKVVRRTLTDAIQESLTDKYGDKTNVPFYEYSNPSDALNKLLTGHSAKYWCEKFQCGKDELRDHWGSPQLKRIDLVETMAQRKVDEGMKPTEAIKAAIEFMGYEVWDEDQLVGKGDKTTYQRKLMKQRRANQK